MYTTSYPVEAVSYPVEAGWLNRLPWTGSYPRAWWCTGWRCLWSATDWPGGT